MAADSMNGNPPASASSGKDNAAALRNLETTADRILKHIPTTPYYLTVPTERPYIYGSRQEAANWMIGDLFEAHEENLQYSTFLYHEHGENLLVCRSEVDDQRDRLASRRESNANTASNTPSHAAGPKKKISLRNYLKKSDSPAPKQPAGQEDNRDSQSQENGTVDGISTGTHAVAPSTQRTQKRPLAEHTGAKRSAEQSEDEPSPPKKQRVNQDAQRKHSTAGLPKADPTRHGLPALLSPIQTSDAPEPYDLPPILSPTLPPVVTKELEKLERQRRRAASNASSSSEKRLSVQSADGVDGKDQQPDGQKDTTATKPLDAKHDESRANRESHQSTGPVETQKKPPVRRSLVVRLKYGRRNRIAVERILRLQSNKAPERKSTTASAEVTNGGRPRADIVQKDPSRRQEKPSAKPEKRPPAVGDKRPRAEDENTAGISSKRPKAPPPKPEIDKKPRTPDAHAKSSPAPGKSSAQKKDSHFTTPKKMPQISKLMSNDSRTSTPGETSISPSAPLNHNHLHHLHPPHPHHSSSSEDLEESLRPWRIASQTFNSLGRRLKHEAQRLFGEGGAAAATTITPADRRAAAIRSLECILAYMAAFHCTEMLQHRRGRPVNLDHTWKSLVPLWRSIGHRTAAQHPCLEYVRLSLGLCIFGRIMHWNRQAGGREAATAAAAEERYRELADALEDARQCLARRRQLAAGGAGSDDGHGHGAFGLEELRRDFPLTWTGSARGVGASSAAAPAAVWREWEWEDVDPATLWRGGTYWLPLDIDATALHGVRFGARLLGEYVAREGGVVELQLKV